MDKPCAICQKSVASNLLNITERGEVCNQCHASLSADDVEVMQFNAAKPLLIGGIVSVVASRVIHMQSVSTMRFASGGVGTETIEYGPEFGGLIGGGLAVLIAILGLFRVLQIKIPDDSANPAMKQKRLLFLGIFALVICIGAWVVFHSLPYTVVHNF
jgi:hypothetical protein